MTERRGWTRGDDQYDDDHDYHGAHRDGDDNDDHHDVDHDD